MARCVECGRSFPEGETVALEGSRVCAGCKPRFVQKLREGAFPGGAGMSGRADLRFAAGHSRWGRTPGEKAFDRCFLPCVLIGICDPPLAVNLAGSSGVFAWVQLCLGVITAAFWVRALTSLIAGWRDPAARLLRFCALWFLLGLGFEALVFLSASIHLVPAGNGQF